MKRLFLFLVVGVFFFASVAAVFVDVSPSGCNDSEGNCVLSNVQTQDGIEESQVGHVSAWRGISVNLVNSSAVSLANPASEIVNVSVYVDRYESANPGGQVVQILVTRASDSAETACVLSAKTSEDNDYDICDVTSFIAGSSDPEGDAENLVVMYRVQKFGDSNYMYLDHVYVNVSYLDLAAPDILLGSPSNDSWENSTSVNFSFIPNDITSGISNCSLIVDGVLNETNSSVIVEGQENFIITTLSEGPHNWTVNCTDNSVGANEGTNVSARDVNIDVTIPNNVSLNFPADTYNTTSGNVNFNFSVYDNLAATLNCSLYIDSVLSQTNASVLNATISNFNVTGIEEGNHEWNVTCLDLAGNSNSSLTRNVTVDSSFPSVDLISLSPSSEDDIDPGVQINVTVSFSDLVEVDTVIFQYKQNSASVWTNDSMDNNGSKVFVNATFTPNVNGIWSYRVWSNDSLGNAGFSNSTNLSVEYDYSWNVSSVDFGTLSGTLNTNISILLSVNNTGDYVLSFDLSDNAPYGSFYNVTEPFDLAAKEVKHINITLNLGASTREDDVVINVDATSANADPSEKNVSLTLVTYAGGPYLYNNLINAPTSVSQSESVNFYGSSKNIGNETAVNVTLAWVVPSSGWTNSSGNLSQVAVDVAADSTIYNNVTINVSSSVSPGSYTIYLNSTCENVTACSDVESFTIVVSCSSTDGVCGSGCSYDSSSSVYDSDCSAPEIVSGGGGGGGGGAETRQVSYDKVVEIVRGVDEGFEVVVSNEYSGTNLSDLTMELEGFLDRYISISPDKIDNIEFGESKSFFVNVMAPAYVGYEERDLIVTIRGKVIGGDVVSDYREVQNIKLIIQEVARIDSEEMLQAAREAVFQMNESGFNVKAVAKMLDESEDWLDKRRNKKSFDLSVEIVNIKDMAFEADYLLRRIIEAMHDPKKSNLIVDGIARGFGDYNTEDSLDSLFTGNVVFASGFTEDVVGLAISAFERGDYASALDRANEARTLLVFERKGSFSLFVYLHWPLIVLSMIVFSVLGVFGFRKYRKISVASEICDISKEEGNIGKLLIELQRLYFGGKISDLEYKHALEQYQKRLANIRKSRIELRSKRLKMIVPRKILKELDGEKKDVEEDIKEIQRGYYVDKKISEDAYKIQFEIFNERLAEIEDERATLQILQSDGMKDVKAVSKKSKAANKKRKIIELAKKNRQKKIERDIKKAFRKKSRIRRKNKIVFKGKMLKKKFLGGKR